VTAAGCACFVLPSCVRQDACVIPAESTCDSEQYSCCLRLETSFVCAVQGLRAHSPGPPQHSCSSSVRAQDCQLCSGMRSRRQTRCWQQSGRGMQGWLSNSSGTWYSHNHWPQKMFGRRHARCAQEGSSKRCYGCPCVVFLRDMQQEHSLSEHSLV
jgi:hypothetical protein